MNHKRQRLEPRRKANFEESNFNSHKSENCKYNSLFISRKKSVIDQHFRNRNFFTKMCENDKKKKKPTKIMYWKEPTQRDLIN